MAESPQPLVINSQYVKDLSFENPHAPGIYQELAQSQPRLSVNVDVEPRPLGEGLHEVVLKLQVSAIVNETKVFLVELDYAGLVNLKEEGSKPETVTRILFVEIPRYLFPFARAIIANITRDGGLPPLLIQPIDFQKQFLAAQGQGAAAGQTGAAAEAGESGATEGPGAAPGEEAASGNGSDGKDSPTIN